MAKISLWNKRKNKDYYFSDSVLRDYLNQGATGVYLHKYEGPSDGGDVTTIQDVLWLENRSRRYADDIYELRGSYQPESSEFDLSQFGIFISNDTIFMMFHYNDMLDIVGRKLISGDVIELPHLRDPDTLNEETEITKRFYVIEDTMHASEGYGNQWYSHIWKIKASMIVDSPEFRGFSQGTLVDENFDVIGEICKEDNGQANSTYEAELKINDGIVAEAEAEVPFDPKWFETTHLWIREREGVWNMFYWSGDGIPANSYPVTGGDEFPEDAEDDDYFIRTDFEPDRLFRKEGSIWRKLEDDMRKKWTSYNKILDTFIDNTVDDISTDGEVFKTKQALSKVVRPRAATSRHQSKIDEIKGDE